MKTPLETRGSRANDGRSARLGKKQPDGTHAHRIAHVPRVRPACAIVARGRVLADRSWLFAPGGGQARTGGAGGAREPARRRGDACRAAPGDGGRPLGRAPAARGPGESSGSRHSGARGGGEAHGVARDGGSADRDRAGAGPRAGRDGTRAGTEGHARPGRGGTDRHAGWGRTGAEGRARGAGENRVPAGIRAPGRGSRDAGPAARRHRGQCGGALGRRAREARQAAGRRPAHRKWAGGKRACGECAGGERAGR